MKEDKNEKGQNKPEKTVFFIDKEKFETDEEQLSVQALLVDYAEEDPATTTLALKNGNDYQKFTNLDEMVTLKNGMKFVVFHNEPTTVS